MIDDLNGLEKYLDDAQTAAEAAEQAALQEADVLYTTRHRDAGLPRYPLAWACACARLASITLSRTPRHHHPTRHLKSRLHSSV